MDNSGSLASIISATAMMFAVVTCGVTTGVISVATTAGTTATLVVTAGFVTSIFNVVIYGVISGIVAVTSTAAILGGFTVAGITVFDSRTGYPIHRCDDSRLILHCLYRGH